MAAMAIPLIGGAALALLRALGVGAAVGAAAVVARDAAKHKAEAAENAKTAPIAQAASQARTRDACTKCPPDCGTLVTRDWNMSEEARMYQARITGFAPHSEWSFKGTDFDGFKSQLCLLLEAKAKYDQFFPSDTEVEFFFTLSGLRKMVQQATKQSQIVRASPPAQLHWHFMQPKSYAYMKSLFLTSSLPIVTLLTP